MGYVDVIKTAILFFPILSFVLSLPFLIYHYRKYGSVTFLRFLLVFSFFFYLLCIYFLVILPLPAKGDVLNYKGIYYYNLKPFFVVPEILGSGEFNFINPNSYVFLLNEKYLEPLFNIFMTIPFGIYLRYYFRCGFLKTLLLSFGLSLFFELTQLSGLYFIYPAPYRLCDVNDLINNTTGGILGFIIAPILSFFLPSRESIDSVSYARGEKVSFFRRGLALFIDYFFVFLLYYVLGFFVNIDYRFYFSLIFLVFVLLPFIFSGYTFGTWVLRFKYVGDSFDGGISFFRYFVRGIFFHVIVINSWFILSVYCQLCNINLLFGYVLYAVYMFIFLIYVLFCIILDRDIFINRVFGISCESVVNILEGDDCEI